MPNIKWKQDGKDAHLPVDFIFCGGVDDMGYLKGEHLKSILEGKAEDGGKVDAVVYCIDPSKGIDHTKSQFDRIVPIVRQKGLCQLALVSNLTELDYTVRPDTIYTSSKVFEFMKSLKTALRLDISCIHPVITYQDDLEVNEIISCIILGTFAAILQAVDDYL